MAITAAVAVSQSALAPNLVTLTDESTGTDVTITTRRVYITDSQGNPLVESGNSLSYTEWSDFPSDTEITLDILTQDTAVHLLVQYLTSGGTVVTTYENDYALSEYNKQAFYYLIQNLGLTPGVYQDTTFSSNLALMWVNIIGGIQAVEIASDLSAAQNCMNIATNMRIHESMYF